jgi:glycerophosphoryl diester phosphodiesterase
MPFTLITREQIGWLASRINARLGHLVIFSIAFILLEFALLAPIYAWIVRTALESWGRSSVGNFEIISFCLSKPGLIGIAAFGIMHVGIWYLHYAGLMRILAGEKSYRLDRLFAPLPRLLELGAFQTFWFVLLAVPFLLLALGVYFSLWRNFDLYHLLNNRPPIFWTGAGALGLLSLGYGVIAGRWFLRWIFSVPALLFESPRNPKQALRSSAQRTQGRLCRLIWALGGSALLMGLIWLGVLTVLGLLSEWALRQLSESINSSVKTTVAVLAFDVIVLTLLGILGNIVLSALVLLLYREAEGETGENLTASPRQLRRLVWGALGVTIAFGLVAQWLVVEIIDDCHLADRVELTAHRAGKVEAPENTLSALERAIAAKADWAEIDVQLTSDKKLVIIHDSDMRRVGGSPLQIATSSFEQLRAIDIGSWFSPQFSKERIPTLDEFLIAAKGRIRLNIELKPSGSTGSELADGVLAAVRKHDMVDQCRICSQSYSLIQEIKKKEPRFEIGFIAGAAIGDLAGLEVDFLMVENRIATRQFVSHARERGMQVHVWTITDPEMLSSLIDRGVSNVILDDPATFRKRLDEINALEPTERILLRLRNALTR